MSLNPHFAPLLLSLAAAAAALPAQAQNLIQNGGFEADAGLVQSPDAITGWSSAEGGLIGSVASLADTLAPGSGHSTVGAAAGQQYALLDLSQPAYSVLYQSFAIAGSGVSSGSLAFSLFATSFADLTAPALSPFAGLDYESADPMLTVRVDILKPGVDPLSTAQNDLVRTYYPTVEHFGSDVRPTGYSRYQHPLDGSQLQGGQTYTLRFAGANNTAQALIGIDEVSLSVTAVPEPQTWALLLAGLAGVGLLARRRG